jgi:GTP pyrophosphokinase
MRDWISQPRSTGYESLHLTVMGPDKKWIEVQIRSERMDDIAEKGVAAHYKYKEGYRKNSDDQRFENWVLRSVRSWNSSRTFLHRNFLITSNSIFTQKKYLFLRQKVRSKFCQSALQLWILLFSSHRSRNEMSGTKINGKLAPISYVLQNGDQIDILSSQNQKPKADWLEFVVTSKAKSKIKNILNSEKIRILPKEKKFFRENASRQAEFQ